MHHFILLLSIVSIYACSNSRTFPEVKPLSSTNQSEFTACLDCPLNESKNNIYAASFPLAWEEIKTEFPNEITAVESDLLKKVLADNNSLQSLDKSDYQVEKSIEENAIEIKTAFNKTLSFVEKLDNQAEGLDFKGTKVQAFGYYGENENIRILYYNNDQDFAIRLTVQEENQEMILMKSDFRDAPSFSECVHLLDVKSKQAKVNRSSVTEWRYQMNNIDELSIPKMTFNLEHDYAQIVGSQLTLKAKQFTVTKAYQRTAFLLDEFGAKVESEAEVSLKSTSAEQTIPKHPKLLSFDQDFVVFLKKTDQKMPYFALLNTNSELLTKL